MNCISEVNNQILHIRIPQRIFTPIYNECESNCLCCNKHYTTTFKFEIIDKDNMFLFVGLKSSSSSFIFETKLGVDDLYKISKPNVFLVARQTMLPNNGVDPYEFLGIPFGDDFADALKEGYFNRLNTHAVP